MTTQDNLSTQLRAYFKQINQLYDNAVMENNPPLIADLSKAGANLAKQIKDHEQHEGKTVTIEYAREMCANVGRAIARSTADLIGDREISDQVMQNAVKLINEKFHEQKQ